MEVLFYVLSKIVFFFPTLKFDFFSLLIWLQIQATSSKSPDWASLFLQKYTSYFQTPGQGLLAPSLTDKIKLVLIAVNISS